MTIDKPDSLVSMKVSKESFDAMIESGKFSDIEIQRILSLMILKSKISKNPEKDPENKPYKERSRAERMADPIEESTLLHLRSSWQTEECNINNLTY